EGKFFVWTEDEIDDALGEESALFKEAFGITASGNFEGHNILTSEAAASALAAKYGQSEAVIAGRLAAGRAALFALRERRVHPGRDDKVLASWNGLMLAAFAEAAGALGRDDYRRAAVANAGFILSTLRAPDGSLLRTWRQGRAHLMGYLEDYANVAEGLLALYETTFDPQYFVAARELMDHALDHFADPQGGFFDTSDQHEQLVTRPKDIQDNATPSGSAMAVTVLLRLAAFTGESRYTDAAEAQLRALQPILGQHPTGFGQWLTALAFSLGQPREIALVAEPAEAGPLLEVVFRPYRPFKVVALKRPGEESPVPLLAGREALDGRPTAAVCYNFTCRLPVTEPEALKAQLETAPE
ncbi:MAG: thioredoxin domain-containing protein, partial [Anaerolineales bacterium]